MGFFFNQAKGQASPRAKGGAALSPKALPIESLNQLGCRACPRNKDRDLKNPKMGASGSISPSIYILGEAPELDEDEVGMHLSDPAGKFLSNKFPRSFFNREVRINNIVRCGGLAFPNTAEIECCRLSVVKDIEDTKPSVILAVGNQALVWAGGVKAGVARWRGELIATQIGNHRCYVIPIMPPAQVLSRQNKYGPSEYELAFIHDVEKAITLAEKQIDPPRIYHAPYDEGCILITGERGQADFNLLEDHLNHLATVGHVGIDLETKGFRPYKSDAMIYTCSIGTFDKVVAFPIEHPEGWSDSYKRKAHSLLAEFLLNSGRKIAHHLAFEMEWLSYFYGKELLRVTEWEDTLAQANTLRAVGGTNSLDDLTRQHFGFFLKEQSRVDPARFLEFPIKEGLRYNAMDSKWCYQLFFKQRSLIDSNAAYVREYERKIRLAPTLILTEQKGVLVDFDYAEEQNTKLSGELEGLELGIQKTPEVQKYIRRYGSFNPGAPDQVIKLLKDICDRPEIKKQGGGYTSDEEALNKIPSSEVPSAAKILELRALNKLLGTYIKPIINREVVMPDGKIHSRFSSMIAVTGRLASEDPNIQNFPKRKHKEIRGVIVPPEGKWIAALDYGQIEARVFGMASEDKNLVRHLWTGYDIHGHWTDRFMEEFPKIKDWIISEFKVGGDDVKKVRKAYRDVTKNAWVFPQFFGSSVRSCAEDMHVPENIAKDLAAEFWDEFPGVKKWQDKLVKFYERNLYVETLGGRRRRGIMTRNELLNHPVQGTAADIVLEAMNVLSEQSLIQDREMLQPNLNLHDDLTTYVLDEELETSIEEIARIMCFPRFDYINVPLIVECSIGDRWSTLKEIKVFRSNELFTHRSPYA